MESLLSRHILSETLWAKTAESGQIRFSAQRFAEIVHVNVARILIYGAVIYLLLGLRIVKPHEWMVVLRSGKYVGFRKAGIHWVLPFLDKAERVDLRQVAENWQNTPDQILETKVHDIVRNRSVNEH